MAISNPLIVVIDDDTAVRNSLEFSLGIEGFAVHTYESAEDVLQTAELSDCRCLIVDQNMSGMTGLELISSLRRRGVEIPAVLISGHVTPMLTTQARACGVPVVEKPFPGGELLELIRAAVGAQPH